MEFDEIRDNWIVADPSTKIGDSPAEMNEQMQ
jgi:hypothetical protein